MCIPVGYTLEWIQIAFHGWKDYYLQITFDPLKESHWGRALNMLEPHRNFRGTRELERWWLRERRLLPAAPPRTTYWKKLHMQVQLRWRILTQTCIVFHNLPGRYSIVIRYSQVHGVHCRWMNPFFVSTRVPKCLGPAKQGSNFFCRLVTSFFSFYILA